MVDSAFGGTAHSSGAASGLGSPENRFFAPFSSAVTITSVHWSSSSSRFVCSSPARRTSSSLSHHSSPAR